MLSLICSDAACWAATGSMLQAWGTLLGVAAVVYAAWRAGNTFNAFRRQKQEERRMDAAHTLLTFAYKFQQRLLGVRSPGISGFEMTAATNQLKESYEGYSLKSELEQRQLTVAQVILTRLNADRNLWNEIWEHIPTARALFGEKAEKSLRELWAAFVNVQVSAEAYGEDSLTDPEFTKSLRRDLYGHGADNPVTLQIAGAVAELEELLLRFIRCD
jgi:hypothetical protein